jgi:hypothetical protein
MPTLPRNHFQAMAKGAALPGRLTDITHFLDEDGDKISEPVPARVLGEYFAAIIWATAE